MVFFLEIKSVSNKNCVALFNNFNFRRKTHELRDFLKTKKYTSNIGIPNKYRFINGFTCKDT